MHAGNWLFSDSKLLSETFRNTLNFLWHQIRTHQICRAIPLYAYLYLKLQLCWWLAYVAISACYLFIANRAQTVSASPSVP